MLDCAEMMLRRRPEFTPPMIALSTSLMLAIIRNSLAKIRRNPGSSRAFQEFNPMLG